MGQGKDHMLMGFNDEHPMVEVQMYGRRWVSVDTNAENLEQVKADGRRICLSVNCMDGIATDDIERNPILVAWQQGIQATGEQVEIAYGKEAADSIMRSAILQAQANAL